MRQYFARQVFFYSIISFTMALGCLMLPSHSQAAIPTGFVSVGSYLTQSFGDTESGSRYGLSAEFGRNVRYISLDLRAGWGQEYNDFGGLFNVYYPWELSDSILVLGGVGVGGMYAGKLGDSREPFWDIIIEPHLQLLWYLNPNFGIKTKLAYDYLPTRYFPNSEVESMKETRHRLFFSIALLFGA